MSGHRFPEHLWRRTCADCLNGCGTLGRQMRTASGVGYVEYFVGLERTGQRSADVIGVWSITVPQCLASPKKDGGR